MSDPGARAVRPARVRRLLVVAALALVVRAGVFAINASHEDPLWSMPDSASYLKTAQDLLGLPVFEGSESRRGERTPLYPLWLAFLLGSGIGSVERVGPLVAAQLALDSLAAPLLFWFASATLPLGWATLLGVALALEPTSLAYANVLMSESLYALALILSVGGLRAALRGGAAALLAFAAVLGLTPLVRPVGLYLPWLGAALIALFPPARRDGERVRPAGRLRASAVVLLVGLAPVVLWSTRNFLLTGSFELSSTSAWNRALFARAVARAAGEPERPLPASPPWALEFGLDRGLSPTEIGAARDRYASEVVRAHPGAALRLWLTNLAVLTAVPDGTLASLLREHPPEQGRGAGARLAWLLGLGPLGGWIASGSAASVAGIIAIPWLLARLRHAPNERRALVVLLAALALYHLALGALISGQGARFRVPVMPLLLWLGVLGLRSLGAGERCAPRA